MIPGDAVADAVDAQPSFLVSMRKSSPGRSRCADSGSPAAAIERVETAEAEPGSKQ
jgi:hypothetical protein